MAGLEVLEHPFTPYKPLNGGYAGGIRKGDARCGICGVGKAFHRKHDYHGYDEGGCMYCDEHEHHIVHEKVQRRLI